MKRILHIVGSMDRAGAETMIMNLYRVLNKNKFQFDFLYFTDKKCDYDDEIQNLGGRIFRVRASNPFKRMKATTMLLKNHPEWQTVHCHTLFSNAFHIFAAYKANIPQRISHSHNTSDSSNQGLKSVIYHRFSRMIQNKYATDFVACGTEAGHFLFPTKQNIEVIPNSIDTKKFAEIAQQNKDYLRNKFNLDSECLILLQLGRFTEQKNHFFTLKIIKKLKDKSINFHCFFAGQGPLENMIQMEVDNKGLSDHITFLGLRKDIPRLLGSTDLMLMPSLHEGFPVVLVESQASGTPSYISDKIAKEVDLDLGLINFLSIDEGPENWMDAILETPSVSANIQERCWVMKEKGYDIHRNICTLEKIYTDNH